MTQQLGNYLRGLREDRGYTTRQLAAMANCSQPFVTTIENGQRLPHLPQLWEIVQALETDFRPALYFLCLDLGIPERAVADILPEDFVLD